MLKRFPLLLVVVFVNAGCATLLAPKTANIPVTSEPERADVYIDGVLRGQTPLRLELDPKRSYTLVFKKEGFPEKAYELRSEVRPAWVILDVLAGLAPVVVDAATGSWNMLDETPVAVRLGDAKAAPVLADCNFVGTPVWEQASVEERERMNAACRTPAPAVKCNLEGTPEWKGASAVEKKRMLTQCRERGSQPAS